MADDNLRSQLHIETDNFLTQLRNQFPYIFNSSSTTSKHEVDYYQPMEKEYSQTIISNRDNRGTNSSEIGQSSQQ